MTLKKIQSFGAGVGLLFLSVLGPLAGAADETIGFRFETNRADALYRLGEEVVFTVTATNGAGAKATAGRVTAKLDNDGTKVLATAEIDLAKTNPFVMKGTLNEPGFVRLLLDAPNIGKRNKRIWGVGFEPEKIRPGGTCPDDFDAFWKTAREKFAREVPVDPRVELVPERSQGAFNFYRVSFAAIRGTRIWGLMSVPKDKSKAPFPVLFEAPSAGMGIWCIDMTGRPDCIMMYMKIHEFEPPRKLADLPACFERMQKDLVARGQHPSYGCAGLDGAREDYYFYRVILGLDRAVDWLWSRDDVDRTRFCYTGGSQGGYLGWCLLGLNHKFTSAVLRVPAGSDTRGYRAGRNVSFPNPIAAYPKEKHAVVERNMAYYDGVSFAPRITCPIRVSVGFTDTICSPSAVYATYNMLGSKDKQILNAIGCGHGGQTRHYDEIARRWQRNHRADVVERHLPKTVMGRDFWRVLYKYGDWSSASQAVRYDNPSIYDSPAFQDVVWSYFGRRKTPGAETGRTLWRTLAEYFEPNVPDREILSSNPHPDRPLYVTLTGKRTPVAGSCACDLDRAEYAVFLKTHPNLVYDGWMAEWCNDLLLAYPRLAAMPEGPAKTAAAAVLGKVPPRNRAELVGVLRRFFDRQKKASYDGRVCVFDAHLNSFHQALDFGASMIALETTDSTGNGTTADEKAYFPAPRTPAEEADDNSSYRWNVSAMFARGAARQFRTLWEWYIADYTNGWTEDGRWRNNSVCVYPRTGAEAANFAKIRNTGDCARGPEYGQSASNFRRACYLAYVNGPNFMNVEEWSAQLTMWDSLRNRTVLSPRGHDYVEFADFTRRHPDRGAVYTPVAICVPVDQGYPTWGGYPWGLKRCGYTRGDAAVDAVMFTVVPGFERAKAHLRGVECDIPHSPLAQMYDVIAPDAKRQSPEELLATMKSYRALVVAGDYPDKGWEKTLAKYEAEGGRVIRLGEKDVPAFPEEKINDLKGGKIVFPEVAKILKGLQDDYFPLTVEGDVCYGLNRTPTGWWLWAFNSKGVVKFVDKPERIDRGCDATVRVTLPPGFGTSVREITRERDVALANGVFTVQVPAGDLAIFEIK